MAIFFEITYRMVQGELLPVNINFTSEFHALTVPKRMKILREYFSPIEMKRKLFEYDLVMSKSEEGEIHTWKIGDGMGLHSEE